MFRKVLSVLLILIVCVSLFGCGEKAPVSPDDPGKTESSKGPDPVPSEKPESSQAPDSSEGSDPESEPQGEAFDAKKAADVILSYFAAAPHVGETAEELRERIPFLRDTDFWGDSFWFEFDHDGDENYPEKDGVTVMEYGVTSGGCGEETTAHAGKAIVIPDRNSYLGVRAGITAAFPTAENRASVIEELVRVYEQKYELNTEEEGEILIRYEKGREDLEDDRELMRGYPLLSWTEDDTELEVFWYFEYGSEAWNSGNDPYVFKNQPVSDMARRIISILNTPPKPGEEVSDYEARFPLDLSRRMDYSLPICRVQTGRLEKYIVQFGAGPRNLLLGETFFNRNLKEDVVVVNAVVKDKTEAEELYDIMYAYYESLLSKDRINEETEKSEKFAGIGYDRSEGKGTYMTMTENLKEGNPYIFCDHYYFHFEVCPYDLTQQ